MKRIFIALLDSFGIGGARDATNFDDNGADTLGHVAQYYIEHKNCKLNLPYLNRLGLSEAYYELHGKYPPGMKKEHDLIGLYGYASEISSGKDTISGHWEITGVPVLSKWGYFPNKMNSFPSWLLDSIIKRTNIIGILGNCHASGTTILDELGEEHITTKKPIFYTSADSVFQIACHEEAFGLKNLYDLCDIVRDELNKQACNIGRVIARPFIGKSSGQFIRTGNRKDYAIPPPEQTVLRKFVEEKNGNVISIGKISDIYSHDGITKSVKATGIDDIFDKMLQQIKLATNDSIVFANFVDFDSTYGHRRNPLGYGNALEEYDKRLPELLSLIGDEDLLILTADHGCDPTWKGTDHTREQIPVLLFSPKLQTKSIGQRETFADIGQTIATYFNLTPMKYGRSIKLL